MKLVVAFLLIHSWYPQSCCHDQHCHPVPCNQIYRTAEGDYAWLRGPGDIIFFSKESMQSSQDADCHVCVTDEYRSLGLCIFLPTTS